RALDALVERHEALRMTFSPDGGSLCVSASLAMPLVEETIGARDPHERKRAIDVACRRAAAEPFDLVKGPLVRAHLLQARAGDRENVLVIVSHHLVCDGWSLGVLARELGQLYCRERTKSGPELPAAIAFSACAADRFSAARKPAEDASRAYWFAQFKDLPAPLDMPLDRPRPGERTFAADRVDYTLPASLVRDLKTMGTAHGASIV